MADDMALAPVLAEAFLHYPSMDYSFEGESEESQLAKLVIVYKGLVEATRLYGKIVTSPDGTGALLWLPGKVFPLGLLREIRTSLVSLPFRIGFRPTWRLTSHEDASVDYIVEHGGPHIGVIWNVGVTPAGQRRGNCRFMIETAINQMKAAGLTEVWLSTDTETNLIVYTQLGFQVMTHRVISCSGLRNWVLSKSIASSS
ncbi:hypothetical protein AC1031_006013 [Aphanomyces cochlioides]|nr:hypothetical protein AC1031_006013 [Aphanomyces cochlioides]